MKYNKISATLCLLILSICILINVLRICNTSTEHLTTSSNTETILNSHEARLNTIEQTKPQQMIVEKKNYITPPALSTTGLYYASGPLSNSGSERILSRSASSGTNQPPIMEKKPDFIRPKQWWFYDKDGYIRNKWDSINNQMGSCIYKTDSPSKCSDTSYNSQSDCTSNNKTWYQAIGLTKQHSKCDKWTWDSYGRILRNNSTGTKECLIPLKTTTDQIIAGIETCTDNNIKEKQLWTFY